jgi:hypothetical protein
MVNATLFYFLFHRFVMRRVHFTHSNFAWGLHCEMVWRLACFGAALTWLWLGFCAICAEELCHFHQRGSTVRTLISRPTGRFAWTNHFYFQITQPGSRTVTPVRHREFKFLTITNRSHQNNRHLSVIRNGDKKPLVQSPTAHCDSSSEKNNNMVLLQFRTLHY